MDAKHLVAKTKLDPTSAPFLERDSHSRTNNTDLWRGLCMHYFSY